LPISAYNLAPGRGLPTLRCRSHLLLPPRVSQHQHFVLTSRHLHMLSISVALTPCDSSCCTESCLRLRYLQASNLALRIGKSLPAFDLARNRHKFQHRLTHRHRTHKQSSTPSFSHSRAFRGGLGYEMSRLCGVGEAFSPQPAGDRRSSMSAVTLMLEEVRCICSRTHSRRTVNDQA
jgi:hypothetical protein